MNHYVLRHKIGRNDKCHKCGKGFELGDHYWSQPVSNRARTRQLTRYHHEACLVDARGTPFPCPVKGDPLPGIRLWSNDTPTFPVRPIEIGEEK